MNGHIERDVKTSEDTYAINIRFRRYGGNGINERSYYIKKGFGVIGGAVWFDRISFYEI